jgi:hypothetical protein
MGNDIHYGLAAYSTLPQPMFSSPQMTIPFGQSKGIIFRSELSRKYVARYKTSVQAGYEASN